MQHYVNGRHGTSVPSQQAHNVKRPLDPDRAQAQNLKLTLPRAGSPAGMRPPFRPSSRSLKQSGPGHHTALSASSYPSSTTGSVTEVPEGPVANSQKLRARANQEGHDISQLVQPPSTNDAEESEEEEDEFIDDERGLAHAMSRQFQGGYQGAWPANTDGYSDSNMAHEDDTVRRDLPEIDPFITDPLMIAQLTMAHKDVLVNEWNMRETARQQELANEQEIARQQEVAQQEHFVRQQGLSHVQPQSLAQQPNPARSKAMLPAMSVPREVPVNVEAKVNKPEAARKLFSPIPDQVIPQRPASTGLPNRTFEPMNTLTAHFPEMHPIQSPLPQKRRVTELDYTPEQLQSMEFETLAGQSFDFDPSRTEMPEDDYDDASLRKTLADMLSRQPNDQGHFLSALSFQQWQKSGEWFNKEFAQLNERMVESRSKRREIAHKYENIIAKRHEEVVKERAVYDKALKGMGRSGQHVIAEGTPRRKK